VNELGNPWSFWFQWRKVEEKGSEEEEVAGRVCFLGSSFGPSCNSGGQKVCNGVVPSHPDRDKSWPGVVPALVSFFGACRFQLVGPFHFRKENESDRGGTG
jgi:hypothetical protein